MKFIIKNKWKIIFTIIGAIIGYLYYYYIGCASGTCPIQSKWYLSTLYGAIFGYLISGLFFDKKKVKKQENVKDN
ncbi:MAG: hypothetical protein GX879_04640 [Bacteroidales bacterium]|nr:hypothetical protein [Bacteroidales bacterium]